MRSEKQWMKVKLNMLKVRLVMTLKLSYWLMNLQRGVQFFVFFNGDLNHHIIVDMWIMILFVITYNVDDIESEADDGDGDGYDDDDNQNDNNDVVKMAMMIMIFHPRR